MKWTIYAYSQYGNQIVELPNNTKVLISPQGTEVEEEFVDFLLDYKINYYCKRLGKWEQRNCFYSPSSI